MRLVTRSRTSSSVAPIRLLQCTSNLFVCVFVHQGFQSRCTLLQSTIGFFDRVTHSLIPTLLNRMVNIVLFKIASFRRSAPGVTSLFGTSVTPRTSHCTNNKNKGNLCLMMLRLWSEQDGQDIAEYAMMMAVILMLVAATVRLIGSNATNTFAAVGSSITQ
jgi:Flp pilus assembly pilin Flp